MIKIKKHNTVWMFQFDLLWYILDMFGGVSSKATALKHFIFIHSQEEDNLPLIAHEKDHLAHQKRIGFWNFVKKYRNDKVFRFSSELRAHAIEYLNGGDLEDVASAFHENYDLHFYSKSEPQTLILSKAMELITSGDVDLI